MVCCTCETNIIMSENFFVTWELRWKPSDFYRLLMLLIEQSLHAFTGMKHDGSRGQELGMGQAPTPTSGDPRDFKWFQPQVLREYRNCIGIRSLKPELELAESFLASARTGGSLHPRILFHTPTLRPFPLSATQALNQICGAMLQDFIWLFLLLSDEPL